MSTSPPPTTPATPPPEGQPGSPPPQGQQPGFPPAQGQPQGQPGFPQQWQPPFPPPQGQPVYPQGQPGFPPPQGQPGFPPPQGQPGFAPPQGQPQAQLGFPPPQAQPVHPQQAQPVHPQQGQPGFPPPQGQPGFPPPQGQPVYPPPQGQPVYPPPQGQPVYPQQPTDGQWGQPQQPMPGQPEQTMPAASLQSMPEPKKKNFFARHKVLTVMGAVVLLAIIGAIMPKGGDKEPTAANTAGGQIAATQGVDEAKKQNTEKDEKKADEPKTVGIGTPVLDGEFQVTVTKVDKGVNRVGDEFLGTDAQGKFVLVHLEAKNTADKAEYFFGSQLKLIDTEGREHATDGEAQIYLGNIDAFLGEVNPGNTVKGAVVFDIPKDAVPATLQLPGSLLTDGPMISLK